MSGLKDTRNKKLIYHLTKLQNLESILQNGLMSRTALIEKEAAFEDVADPEIIDKRELQCLDAYVPFHFHAYAAFDYAVMHKYPNDDFVYITVKREFARNNGFCIIPRHPLSCNAEEIYEYQDGFNMIDWDVLEDNSRNDEEAKLIRMAECLSKTPVNPRNFCIIYVKDKIIQSYVLNLLKAYKIYTVDVKIKEIWFDRIF